MQKLNCMSREEKVFRAGAKLKCIVVPNVTGNVKPYKRTRHSFTDQWCLLFLKYTRLLFASSPQSSVFICQQELTTASPGTPPTTNHLFGKRSPPASAVRGATGCPWKSSGEASGPAALGAWCHIHSYPLQVLWGRAGITSLERKGAGEHAGPRRECLINRGVPGEYQHPTTESTG